MSIFVDENTRVIVQGATGHQGRFHMGAMQEFGTKVVAGVTPGKGGESVYGIPVYNTVEESMEREPNASVIFVPAPNAKDAVMEALDAGIKTVVVITDHIPVHDAMKFVNHAIHKKVKLIGPNCPGIASPEKSKMGIIPNMVLSKGNVGVISRSGTLTYEIVNSLTERNLGQSTCIGLGGDPIIGTTFVDALEAFERDIETKAIVLVGEIGGTAEEEAAAHIRKNVTKPAYVYIAGRSAPPRKKMGHAGAIISGGKGTAELKRDAFRAAGAKVAVFPQDIAEMIKNDMAI